MRVAVLISIIFIIATQACVKPFLPPPSANNLNYLVVDGVLAVGSPTQIKLSRTKDIGDTVLTVAETGARLWMEGEAGDVYDFSAGEPGIYAANGATTPQRYRLRILTQGGDEYLSEFVDAKISPPIDSLVWREDDDIFIYVNTHDESASTRYYRWEFEETSEYHAVYDSNIEFRNGELIFIGPEEMRYACFSHYPSTSILISSSSALGEDVISNFLVTTVPNDNSKISFRYSILVKQYALTQQAYKYLQIVKQNSEQTGNIFDPQPSQLYGNIHHVKRPEEPVIGYITASTVSEKRIFIRQSQLSVIRHPNTESCKEIFISPSDAPEWLSSGRLMPAYYTQGSLAIAPKECVDCRLAGGTTTKPSYW